jgi:membrane fusion protein, multidrug efflux system
MKQRQIVIIASVAVLVIGGYFTKNFLAGFAEPSASPQPGTRVRHVATDTVRYQAHKQLAQAAGRVRANELLAISSEAAGRVSQAEVPLREGAKFKKGQALFTIYRSEAELKLKAAKSEFMSQLAALMPDLRIDYPHDFAAIDNFFSQLQAHKPMPPLPQAANGAMKVFLSGRGILPKYYGILQQELALERHTAYAPFDGSFAAVHLREGSFAQPGSKVADILNSGSLELEAPVMPWQAGLIRIGETVALSGDGVSVNARVERISPLVDIATQRVSVYLSIPAAAAKGIFPGQYLQAEFSLSTAAAAYKIDRSAVYSNSYIFIISGGKLLKAGIKVDAISGKYALISGIEEGTLAVTEPLAAAREGDKAEPLPAKPKQTK